MTQYGFEPLSPEDSGSTLLERVNGIMPALLTNHKGAARPDYIQPGMKWIDDSGALWPLNLYDGARDVPIAIIDPVTHSLSMIGKKLTINGESEEQGRLEFQAAGVPKWTLLRDADNALKIFNEMIGAAAVTFDKATNKANFAQPPMIAGVSLLSMLGGIKNARFITASGNIQPTAGTSKWLGILVGGGAKGNDVSGTSAGYGGGGGAGCLFLAAVSDAASYAAVIGGVGGNSTLTIGSTAYTANGGTVGGGAAPATGGIVNRPGSPGSVAVGGSSGGTSSGLGGFGGDGPFGFGAGGAGAYISAWVGNGQGFNGIAGIGYGAGGGGAAATGGSGVGGAGTPGCLLILEF